jgi:hypothetical protein
MPQVGDIITLTFRNGDVLYAHAEDCHHRSLLEPEPAVGAAFWVAGCTCRPRRKKVDLTTGRLLLVDAPLN